MEFDERLDLLLFMLFKLGYRCYLEGIAVVWAVDVVIGIRDGEG